jgi:hypothetical protein
MKIIQLTICALLAMFLCGFGCSSPKPTPDPLAGWQLDFKQPDQAIEKDFQDYIHKLPPNESGPYQGAVFFYEDGKGQHTFRIETNPNNERWYHVLIYDKENKRIKTMKYNTGRIMS